MKMTKIGIVAAVCGLVFACVGTTQAQVVGAKAKRGQRAIARQQAGTKHEGEFMQLLQQLNLTPDQKKQIMTIATKARQQNMGIQQNTALSATDKKTQEKATGKEARKEIVAVLTPAQKQQLKQLIAQRRQMKAGKSAITTPVTPPATTQPTAPTGSTAPTPNSPKTGAATGSPSVHPVAGSDEDDELDVDLSA